MHKRGLLQYAYFSNFAYLNGTDGNLLQIYIAYGLDDRGSGFRFQSWTGNFSALHLFPTGSVAHPASCQMGTGASLPKVNSVGA
jgi:hypothetical protein